MMHLHSLTSSASTWPHSLQPPASGGAGRGGEMEIRIDFYFPAPPRPRPQLIVYLRSPPQSARPRGFLRDDAQVGSDDSSVSG